MLSLRRIFGLKLVYPHSDVLDQRRSIIIMRAGLSILVLFFAIALWTIPQIVAQPDNLKLYNNFVLVLVVGALTARALYQNSKGNLLWASWLLVLTIFLGAVASAIQIAPVSQEWLSHTPVILLTIPLFLSGVLLSGRDSLVFSVIVVLTLVIAALVQIQGILNASLTTQLPLVLTDIGVLFIGILTIVLLSRSIWIYIDYLRDNLTTTLGFRRNLINYWTGVTRQQTQNDIINYTLEVLDSNLGYPYAQVILTDDENHITQAQRRLMKKLETVSLDNLSISSTLIEVIMLRQSVAISLRDPQPRRTHFFPSSRFGVAVPIIQQNKVLGVLDVQTDKLTRFSSAEVELFELLAVQVGVAIVGQEQRNLADRMLSEQRVLNERLQNQLQLLQGQQQMANTRSWEQYIQGRGHKSTGYDLDPQTAAFIPSGEMPAALAVTMQRGELYMQRNVDSTVINVPIRFRQQVLGAMAFRVPSGQTVTQRQLDVARTVAERLASVLESTRLLEQTQAQAQRERKASEITNLLISATDVRGLLNTAVENFHEALGSVHTRIFVQPTVLNEPRADLSQQES